MTNKENNGGERHRDQSETNGAPVGTALVPADVAYGRGGGALQAPLVPAFLSAKPNSILLLRALKRRWLLATTLGLLAAAVAAVLTWFVMPVTYTAQSYLFVSSLDPRIVGAGQATEFTIYQRSLAALMTQRFVLLKALRQPAVAELSMVRELGDRAPEWLENNVQVDFGKSPEFLRVSLVGDRSQMLELGPLLQSVTAAFLDEVFNDEQKARTDRLQRLRDILSKNAEDLRTKRQTFRNLAETAGTTNSFVLAFKQQFDIEQLQRRKNRLLQVQEDLLQLRVEALTKQDKLKVKPNLEIPADVLDRALAKDPGVRGAEQELELAESRSKKAAKAFKDGDKNPMMKTYQEKTQNLQQALNALRLKRRTEIADEIRSNFLGQEREKIGNFLERIIVSESLERKLKEEVDKLNEGIKTSARTSVDLETLKEEMDSTDDIVKRLKGMIDLETLNRDTPSRVRYVGDGTPDVMRTEKEQKQMMIAGATGAGAMALVFLVIAYWEFLARRIVTADDVVYGLGWRLVGAIPDIPNRHRRTAAADDPASKHWSSLLTESIDAARAMLLKSAATEGIRTVMITSAVAGEGKTSLSCHLSISLARAGRKTLLIDGDLRRPSVHQMFDLPVEPGFAGLLRVEAELADVVRSTRIQNLWMIPAGQCNADTLQALAQGRIGPLLDRAKEEFDFIIVDSSPVLPVVDALEIGQNVDVVIFSLLRDVSRFPNVYAAYERMTSLGIRVIGAVVNGVRKDHYGYAYRYYYSHGYTK